MPLVPLIILTHVQHLQAEEAGVCIAGEILQGHRKPDACPAFGTVCTPDNPMGSCMVSSEGACAAYWSYGRFRKGPEEAAA